MSLFSHMLYTPLNQFRCQFRQKFMILKRIKRGQCSACVLLHQFSTSIQTLKPDERVLGFIRTDTLAHLFRCANGIKHIIANLERKAKAGRKLRSGPNLLHRSTTGNHTKYAGRID